MLDRWYKTLPEVAPGVRRFGMDWYREPPTAMPPTLTLYVGHEAVDLDSLKVPLNVEVIGPDGMPLKDGPDENDCYIDPFARTHGAKRNNDRDGTVER